MRIKFTFFLIFSVCILLFSQTFEERKLKQLESLTVSNNNHVVLSQVNRILQNQKISENLRRQAEVLKLETLIDEQLYEEGLVLSNTILKKKDLSPDLKFKTHIQRALLYEVLASYKNSEAELKQSLAVLEKQPVLKEKYYPLYLIRLSSFYRVQKKDREFFRYISEAAKYASKINNYRQLADINMLLGFHYYEENSKIAEGYFLESERYQILAKNKIGEISAKQNLAVFYKEQKKLGLAKNYVSKVLTKIKRFPERHDILADAYLLKSTLFRMQNKPDSALANFQKFYNHKQEHNLENKMLKISEQDSKLALQNEELKISAVEKELKTEKTISSILYIFIGSLIICFAVLGFILRKLHLKNILIEKKQQEIKHKNTALKKKIAENQFLTKELNHRVKNNLAMIQSLIQFRISEEETEAAKKRMLDLYQRINSISLAHNLYTLRNSFGSSINIKEYVHRILKSVMIQHYEEIILHEQIENIEIDPDIALYIGLLVNELSINSLKHAKPKSLEKLSIDVSIMRKDNDLFLTFSDNGLEFMTSGQKNSTGSILISGMISQLEASYRRKGSLYEIEIPLEKKSEESLNFAV